MNHQLVIPSINILPAYSEVFLGAAISVILLVDAFLPDKKRHVTYILSQLSLLVCLALNLAWLIDGHTTYTFTNMFVNDPMSNLLKVATYLVTMASLAYSRRYVIERGIVSGERGGEFYSIALFSVLGQMVMLSGNNFLTIYLGLELMSLALYAMVALRRDDVRATEASMKYFILGALSSGFLLYGMSMVYGATGSLDLVAIAREFSGGASTQTTIMVFGLVFIVSGLAFKIGVVPFHMWIPDVYQGAPTPVAMLIGGAPKIAAFAISLRLLVEGMIVFAVSWQQMLMILAILSMALGNIAAIAQTSFKRLLGYSTIAQMGYMLLGLMTGVVGGNAGSAASAYSSAMFYVLAYTLTAMSAFGVLILLSHHGYDADHLDDLRGLHKRKPWAALVMLVAMFSLTGIPPTIGFFGKLAVINSVVDAGMPWLAVFAVMMSLIGAFYYLRVVKLMYFDEPTSVLPIEAPFDMRVVLMLNGVLVLLIGILPGGLLELCFRSIVLTLTS
jgi:NADH-quinone oxidoreductase subunit N